MKHIYSSTKLHMMKAFQANSEEYDRMTKNVCKELGEYETVQDVISAYGTKKL